MQNIFQLTSSGSQIDYRLKRFSCWPVSCKRAYVTQLLWAIVKVSLVINLPLRYGPVSWSPLEAINLSQITIDVTKIFICDSNSILTFLTQCIFLWNIGHLSETFEIWNLKHDTNLKLLPPQQARRESLFCIKVQNAADTLFCQDAKCSWHRTLYCQWIKLLRVGHFGGTNNRTLSAWIKILRPLFNTN